MSLWYEIESVAGGGGGGKCCGMNKCPFCNTVYFLPKVYAMLDNIQYAGHTISHFLGAFDQISINIVQKTPKFARKCSQKDGCRFDAILPEINVSAILFDICFPTQFLISWLPRNVPFLLSKKCNTQSGAPGRVIGRTNFSN